MNPELRRRWRDAQERAVAALAQGYVKQAGYEASEGRWAEASWSLTAEVIELARRRTK